MLECHQRVVNAHLRISIEMLCVSLWLNHFPPHWAGCASGTGAKHRRLCRKGDWGTAPNKIL